MYKTASDRQAALSRTGSHATMPSATGLVRVLPPDAQVREEMYQSVKAQIAALGAQVKALSEEASWVNDRLKFTVPIEEFRRLSHRKELLSNQVQTLQMALSDFRSLARAVGIDAWATVYMEVAYKMLPREDERVLYEAAKEIMGREKVELRKGYAELGDGARQSIRDRENRKGKAERYQSTKEKLDAAKAGQSVGGFPAYYKPPGGPANAR